MKYNTATKHEELQSGAVSTPSHMHQELLAAEFKQGHTCVTLVADPVFAVHLNPVDQLQVHIGI